MNLHTHRSHVDGPAGRLTIAEDVPQLPDGVALRGLAVLCHPHPLFGGTMDNKVVQTLARAFVQLGWRVVRFNFRGVGGSAGAWDEGRGEIDDALAVIAATRQPGETLVLGGFSFGGYVTTQAAARLPQPQRAARLVLVAPASANFDCAPVPADSLVIHGDADEVVPLAATLDWARPQVLPVLVVPGVGHFFHGQLGLLRSVVVQELSPRQPL